MTSKSQSQQLGRGHNYCWLVKVKVINITVASFVEKLVLEIQIQIRSMKILHF